MKKSTKGNFKPAKGKSWVSKVSDSTKKFKVEKLDKDWTDMEKGEKMLIATPQIVYDYILQIPAGKEVTMLTMRKDLAIAHRADNSCPLTTGIFLRIAAEAALEQIADGKPMKSVAPFWRVISPTMAVAKKLSCGVEFIEKQRRKEKLS